MRQVLLVGLLSILILAAACSTAEKTEAPQAPAATVYEGARLIVGDGSNPIEDSAFVVQNNKFTAVGRKGQITVPEGAAHVDLTGKTVMPAIVDTHTHMSTNREELVSQLQHKAYYGTGVLMSLGQDTGDVAFQVRDEIIPGAARLRTAGRGITAPEPGRTEAPYWIQTEEEGRKAVQELAARKVDIVKIWVDDRMGMVKKLAAPLYTAVIDEAHKNGLRVTAHWYTLADAKSLLRAGLDASAHGIRDRDIDNEVITMFKERPNFVYVPNLPDRGVATDLSWLSQTVPPEALSKMQAGATDRPDAQKLYGIQARNLAKVNQAGVKIALGTDGSNAWAAHQEMADMVEAGMTPAQVLQAATGSAAEFLRMPDVGTIAADKSADFLVLDANPLDDINNTRKLSSVYLRGEQVDRAQISQRMLTSKPAQGN